MAKQVHTLDAQIAKFPLNKYLFTAARRIWRWHPVRKAALLNAKKICNVCKRQVETLVIDHISPVIDPAVGFTNWDNYYRRLFVVSLDHVQALCRSCHKKKTASENKTRRLRKRGSK